MDAQLPGSILSHSPSPASPSQVSCSVSQPCTYRGRGLTVLALYVLCPIIYCSYDSGVLCSSPAVYTINSNELGLGEWRQGNIELPFIAAGCASQEATCSNHLYGQLHKALIWHTVWALWSWPYEWLVWVDPCEERCARIINCPVWRITCWDIKQALKDYSLDKKHIAKTVPL